MMSVLSASADFWTRSGFSSSICFFLVFRLIYVSLSAGVVCSFTRAEEQRLQTEVGA